MADPEAASTQVTLLVPHPTRVAVLMSGTALPSVTLPGHEPLLSEIVSATDLLDERAVVLRHVLTSPGYDIERGAPDGTTTLLVEIEPGADQAPDGWEWRDLDDDVLARLEPASSRTTVTRWVTERTEGWAHRRPPWSRPGWFARASDWMVEQLLGQGRPAVEAPRQHQLWGLSVVLRAKSTDGDVYLKASADIFRHEAVVTERLARETPTLMPAVMAVEPTAGWLLMRDLGAAELGHQDAAYWHEGLVALAGVQRHWLGRKPELEALGLPDRSLEALAAEVEVMAEDTTLLWRLPDALREHWLATVPALIESCRRLTDLGPGPTLVHGDFHPWNVVHGPDGTRIFDWTDAAVSHPFVDLATYVFRTKDVSVRRRLVDAYVEAWSGKLSRADARQAAELGLVVGSVYQVQTYRRLLPALMADGKDDGMSQADLAWVKRALARHEQGVESTD